MGVLGGWAFSYERGATVVVVAKVRCSGGIFAVSVCGEGLERYFSKEVEGHFIVWFCGGCAGSFGNF